MRLNRAGATEQCHFGSLTCYYRRHLRVRLSGNSISSFAPAARELKREQNQASKYKAAYAQPPGWRVRDEILLRKQILASAERCAPFLVSGANSVISSSGPHSEDLTRQIDQCFIILTRLPHAPPVPQKLLTRIRADSDRYRAQEWTIRRDAHEERTCLVLKLPPTGKCCW